MIGTEQKIAAGYGAFKRKDFAAARQALNGVDHPQAVHLLGLVEKGAGNYQLAASLLAQAWQMDPSNHEILNNQGLLARLTGELSVAEVAFRRALDIKPGFHAARLSLGRTLSGLGRTDEAMIELAEVTKADAGNISARVAYANAALDANDFEVARTQINAALALDPNNPGARYANGVLMFNLGEVAASEEIFTSLLQSGTAVGEASYMMARVRLEEGNIQAASAHAETSFKTQPAGRNLSILADIYWMSGNFTKFDALLKSALSTPILALTALVLMRKAERQRDALEQLDAQPDALQQAAPFQAFRSALLLDLGEVEQAVSAGKQSYKSPAENEDNMHYIRALLANGEAKQALDLIRAARKIDPFSQFWLGYEATALRLLGDPGYADLLDYDRHVRTYELGVPEGFVTLSDFNAALLDVLDEMNPFQTHPLNQSLRGGGQAPHDLTLSNHPTLKAYFKALDWPIREYMSALGTADAHPSSARNTGAYKFSGAWTVRLKGGGHHVNHVHPRGWISSAYYVSVPEETAAGNDRAGWIKFGEPPMRTEPILGPEKWIQPRAGLVVLFPSFLWHGTHPIHDGSVRVTAPFDVVPA